MSWSRSATRFLEELYREWYHGWEALKIRIWGDPYDYGFGPSLLDRDGIHWEAFWYEPLVLIPTLLVALWGLGSLLLIWLPRHEDKDLTKMRLWLLLGALLFGWGLIERFYYYRPGAVMVGVLLGFLPALGVWWDRCPQCRRRWLKIDVDVGETTVSTWKECPDEDCDYTFSQRTARSKPKKAGPYDAMMARALSRSSRSSSSSSSSSRASSSGGGGGSYSSGSSGSFGGGSSGGGGAGRGF